ncbi:translocase of inner mitochondrial membrane 23 [Brevipalpus obovatus]|uniref:translocase of inner mitochondrial membrane 23 n=1 Tax=Brevipalpus obovatus TaxID=246614 RepID=UPI003D9FA1B9
MDNSSGIASPPPLSGPFSTSSPLGFSSPYLNFDPKALNAYSTSDYIYPDGRTRASRGRFEYAFSQIGGSVMAGAAVGGVVGGYNGLKFTSAGVSSSNLTVGASASASAQQTLSWAVRRSQILNYIVKTGALTANTFGLVALIYSGIDVGLSFKSENHELNCVTAGTLTGILFRGLSSPEVKPDSAAAKVMSSSRWQLRLRRAGLGGLVGLSLSSLYTIATNREKFYQLMGR